MQTANIILDIGGDAGNQIPKSGITAAEIAVLIAIHGEAAVHDIEPAGEIDRSNRDELNRLHQTYGHAKDGEDKSIVGTLFPGAAARVFDKLDELGLPVEFFKATERASAAPVESKPDPLDHDGDGKKGGSKARKAKKTEAQADPDDVAAAEGIPPGDDAAADDASDGVSDMPDNGSDELFK